MLSGGRYGCDWTVNATAGADGGSLGVLGQFQTSIDDRRKQALQNDPGYPDRAVETAFIWLMSEAPKHGWRIVAFESFSDRYGPAERPYFCLARAIIASERFEPAPGVTYADEMTLDAVMAGAGAAR